MASSSLPENIDSSQRGIQSIHPYSKRDVTVIPSTFDFELVSKFVKSKCQASGDSHVNKGYKYFHEGYIHNITSKYQYMYLSTNS